LLVGRGGQARYVILAAARWASGAMAAEMRCRADHTNYDPHLDIDHHVLGTMEGCAGMSSNF